MFEVVAVVHKPAFKIAEGLDDFHALSRRDQHRVLPAAIDKAVGVGRARVGVAVYGLAVGVLAATTLRELAGWLGVEPSGS